MATRQRVCWREAYTILEVLVVVVLMGLLAAAFIPVLAKTSDKANREKLIADLIQIDVQARQLAKTGSWCMLLWDEQERVIGLIEGRDSPKQIQRVEFPEALRIKFDWSERGIQLNSFGQSPHYGYQIDSGQWSSHLDFNGRTGWYEVRTDAK